MRSRGAALKSSDAGRTWTRRTTGRVLDVDLLGAGGENAWAISERHPLSEASPSVLWRTRDGGATWKQVRVQLRPDARAREIDCVASASGVFHQPDPHCR